MEIHHLTSVFKYAIILLDTYTNNFRSLEAFVKTKKGNSQKESPAWQRGKAREVLKKGRTAFRSSMEDRMPASAHIALTSSHLTLIGRYRDHWWQWPLAAWHTWRMVVHRDLTFKSSERPWAIDADGLDVLQNACRKAPGAWRKAFLAKKCIRWAMEQNPEPHTHALLLVGEGECEMLISGNVDAARQYFMDAMSFKEKALVNGDPLQASRQWCRVARACGLFFLDHARDRGERWTALKILEDNLDRAREVSRDQQLKLERELRKRRLVWDGAVIRKV